MIRLLIQSEDHSLQSMLALTLGEDYQVHVQSHPEQVRKALAEDEADVVILDVESDGQIGRASCRERV